MTYTEIDTQPLPAVPATHHFIVNVAGHRHNPMGKHEIVYFLHEGDHIQAVEKVGRELQLHNILRVALQMSFLKGGHMLTDIEGVPCHLLVVYGGEDTEAAFDAATEIVSRWVRAT